MCFGLGSHICTISAEVAVQDPGACAPGQLMPISCLPEYNVIVFAAQLLQLDHGHATPACIANKPEVIAFAEASLMTIWIATVNK